MQNEKKLSTKIRSGSKFYVPSLCCHLQYTVERAEKTAGLKTRKMNPTEQWREEKLFLGDLRKYFKIIRKINRSTRYEVIWILSYFVLLSTFTSMQYFIFLYRKYLNFEIEAVRSRMFHDVWNKIELYECEPLTFYRWNFMISPQISHKKTVLWTCSIRKKCFLIEINLWLALYWKRK